MNTLPTTNLGKPSAELLIEEFRQLHEHIRQRESSMVQLLVVSIVATTTLISAIAAFFFKTYSEDRTRIEVPSCYLFLIPTLVILPVLAMIASHRQDLYRIGLFIKLFIEERFNGPVWHVALGHYRRVLRGESQDYVPYVVWVMMCLCIGLFEFGLSAIASVSLWHWFAPLPILILLAYEHRRFKKATDIEKIESVWREVSKVLQGTEEITSAGNDA